MHNFVLKIFEFIRNIIKFIQILMLLCIMLTLLYWIQNITKDHWVWMSVCAPFLDIFVNIGKSFSDKSIQLWGAVFEYKYFIAIILYLVLYYLGTLLTILTNLSENIYLKCHQTAKNIEENIMNQSLQKHEEEQKNMLKTFKVFVSVEPKKSNYGLDIINLDEQKKMMNKFLIEKTCVMPTTYNEGFLYNFTSFKTIDATLDALIKLPQSGLPLDYYICIQAFGLDTKTEENTLNNLIKLRLPNKIITSSDTIWRYKSVLQPNYQTKTLGLFQENDNSFEVFEFLPKE